MEPPSRAGDTNLTDWGGSRVWLGKSPLSVGTGSPNWGGWPSGGVDWGQRRGRGDGGSEERQEVSSVSVARGTACGGCAEHALPATERRSSERALPGLAAPRRDPGGLSKLPPARSPCTPPAVQRAPSGSRARDTGVQERFPETARGGPGRLAGRQRRGLSVQGHGRRARPARRHIPPRATPPPAALGLLLSFSGKRPQTPAAEGRRPRTPRATGSLGNGNFGPRRRRRSPARLLPPLPALRRPQRSPRGAGRAGQGGPDGAR